MFQNNICFCWWLRTEICPCSKDSYIVCSVHVLMLSIQLWRLYGHFTDNTSLLASDAERSERQFTSSSTATLHTCIRTIHFWADLCAGKKARLITSHHYIIDAEHSRGYEVSDLKKFRNKITWASWSLEALPWKTSCPKSCPAWALDRRVVCPRKRAHGGAAQCGTLFGLAFGKVQHSDIVA